MRTATLNTIAFVAGAHAQTTITVSAGTTPHYYQPSSTHHIDVDFDSSSHKLITFGSSSTTATSTSTTSTSTGTAMGVSQADTGLLMGATAGMLAFLTFQ
ncbi:hypothetical protein K503DRAFT_870846 [Rhizopogon vinicolor AM-OR11-026]|uniref:Uncharacterized protein n=1 Tax=Rhizopogon vinicolor AM-OR11-026 TaxID=1314800 RepID=A0A1B7ME69_9AGAM|nr:hypothetical protein K503DRAFT_870846 [Rhizopogon vinicolor AM-OR11-026]